MTKHGKTNFRKLLRLMLTAEEKGTAVWTWCGDDLTIQDLGERRYMLSFKNDIITFFADLWQNVVVPLHMTNVMEDIDQSTMVTGTKIPKHSIMIIADERLYSICSKSIVSYGSERI